MYLSYFEEAAYDKLFNEISQNTHYYLKNKEWLSEYFQTKDYYSKSGIEVSCPRLIVTSTACTEETNQQDLVNTRMLYDAFSRLTPLQATNKYMWSYLSHVTFSDYVQKRWMKNPGQSTISTRYFMQGKNGKYDNSISRLWWYGYITFDNSNSNPWHLTETLLMNQQICTDLVDEPYSNNRAIAKGMLQALQEVRNEYPQKGLTGPWRNCVNYINRQGAILNLDFVGYERIQEMTYEYLKKHLN